MCLLFCKNGKKSMAALEKSISSRKVKTRNKMKRSALPLPIVKRRRKRRRKNRFICQGQCGKDGCTYAAESPSNFKIHVSTDRCVCDRCGKDFSAKCNMLRHQTAKHGRAPTRKKLRKPDAIDLTNEQWQFLKNGDQLRSTRPSSLQRVRDRPKTARKNEQRPRPRPH